MENKIKAILTISILSIVLFINFNDRINEHLINLCYYLQYYLLVGFSMTLVWVLFSNKLIRILTVPILAYYIFHLIVNIIEVFNPKLKDIIFDVTYINYGLSLVMAVSLMIIPFINKVKSKK